jgi:hypothetical protein
MVYAEILSALDAESRQRVDETVRHSHWYQRAITEGTACVEFWHAEK